jgi:hypothetical protein
MEINSSLAYHLSANRKSAFTPSVNSRAFVQSAVASSAIIVAHLRAGARNREPQRTKPHSIKLFLRSFHIGVWLYCNLRLVIFFCPLEKISISGSVGAQLWRYIMKKIVLSAIVGAFLFSVNADQAAVAAPEGPTISCCKSSGRLF